MNNELGTKKILVNQYFWNIVFTILFLVVFTAFMSVFGERGANMILNIPVYHFVILALAIFRLTRLMIADHITQWMRDSFMIVYEDKDQTTGRPCVVRAKRTKGLRLLLSDLFGCPWCMGVWSSFVMLGLYVAAVSNVFPAGGFIIVMFALAGVAAIVQLTASRIAKPTVMVSSEGGAKEVPEIQANVCDECGII